MLLVLRPLVYSMASTTNIVGQNSSATYRGNEKANTWTINAYLEYAKTFNEAHNLKVMIGGTGEERSYNFFSAQRSGLFSMDYPELHLTYGDRSQWGIGSSTSGRQISRLRGDYATAGYFGRINYDYKGIYLLELNGRYDGSSSFPGRDRWAFFPSFSVGYRFSQEKYWDKIRDVVDNAKLRFSFGEIGNEAVGDGMFLETIGMNTINYLGVVVVGCTIGTVGVLVLNLGPAISLGPRQLVAVGDLGVSARALLGGDDDSTVRSIRAVECCCGSAFQHGHALDVLGVEVVTTRGEVTVTHTHGVGDGETVATVERRVVHGDTVHDVERLVVARDRGGATQNHLRGGTRGTAGVGHGHTAHTTLQGGDEVGTSRFGNVAGLHVLGTGTHGASHTFHTELTRDHHLLE